MRRRTPGFGRVSSLLMQRFCDVCDALHKVLQMLYFSVAFYYFRLCDKNAEFIFFAEFTLFSVALYFATLFI